MSILGSIRYLIIAPILATILVVNKSIYIPNSYTYVAGSILFILGGLIPTLIYGEANSIVYLPFIVLNICILPLFKRFTFTVKEISIIAFWFAATLSILPGTPGADLIYGNENNYATVALCSCYLALLATNKSILLQLLAAVPFIGFAYASASRTHLAATCLFIGLYLSQKLLRTTFNWVAVGILGFMAIAYITLMLGDPYGIIELVQQNTSGHKAYRGLSYRDVLLFSSLEVLDKYPLGVGWGRSGIALQAFTGETLSPHNTFMKVAVEAGWMAFSGYLIMLVGYLGRHATPLSSAFLIAISLRGLFESATPFTLSLISIMLVLPFFLNERNIISRSLISAEVSTQKPYFFN